MKRTTNIVAHSALGALVALGLLFGVARADDNLDCSCSYGGDIITDNNGSGNAEPLPADPTPGPENYSPPEVQTECCP